MLSTTIALSRLTPGATYTFRLTVVDSTDQSGYGEVAVLMNSAPSSGTFDVDPSSGYSMETDFTFECLNWVDDDLPLKFTFASQPFGVADQQHAQTYTDVYTALSLRADPGFG